MDSEKIMELLKEYWQIPPMIFGVIILIGAIRNCNWLNWTVPDTEYNLPIFSSGWGVYILVMMQMIKSVQCMCAS